MLRACRFRILNSSKQPPYANAEASQLQYKSQCLEPHLVSIATCLGDGLDLPSYLHDRIRRHAADLDGHRRRASTPRKTAISAGVSRRTKRATSASGSARCRAARRRICSSRTGRCRRLAERRCRPSVPAAPPPQPSVEDAHRGAGRHDAGILARHAAAALDRRAGQGASAHHRHRARCRRATEARRGARGDPRVSHRRRRSDVDRGDGAARRQARDPAAARPTSTNDRGDGDARRIRWPRSTPCSPPIATRPSHEHSGSYRHLVTLDVPNGSSGYLPLDPATWYCAVLERRDRDDDVRRPVPSGPHDAERARPFRGARSFTSTPRSTATSATSSSS